MTEVRPGPPAGWFPDPTVPGQSRWWDGNGWTAHVVPPVQPTPAPDPPMQVAGSATPPESVQRAYNFYDEKKDTARGRNTFATNALVLGIVSLVSLPVVPWRWLPFLIGVAAIVWGILGIRRSSSSRIGKRRAVWGLVLGAIAVPIAFVVWGSTLGSSPSTTSAEGFDQAAVETQIIEGATGQGIALSDVECPSAPSMVAGEDFQCLAKTSDGADTSVTVRVQDDAGSITWIVFDRAGTQQQIITGAAAQGISLASVDCPAAPSMNAGDQFQCVATATDGSTAAVNVTWQDDIGSLTWQIG